MVVSSDYSFYVFLKQIIHDFSKTPLELLVLIFELVDRALYEVGEELFSVGIESLSFRRVADKAVNLFKTVQVKPVKTINCNW